MDLSCSTCGTPLEPGASFCDRCGSSAQVSFVPVVAPPGPRSSTFCRACGNGLVQAALVCPGCGTRVARTPVAVTIDEPREKWVAVLLAIVLGFWSWAYTYRDDSVRFWIGFGLSFLIVTIPFVWIWAIIDRSIKSPRWYAHYFDRHPSF